MARSHYIPTSKQIPFKEIPAAAIRAVIKEGYQFSDFRADLFSGIVVGIVALPLAMALAIAVGVSPQFGLYTSIIAGCVVPLLGGSRLQITGPTAAFVVILAPIFLNFGLGGLLTAGILAGFILVLMSIGRVGQLIQYIPHPVTTGFTAGIATVIAVIQLKDFFGLKLLRSPDHFIDRIISLLQVYDSARYTDFGVGIVTLAILILWPRYSKKIPSPLIALTLAAILWAIVKYFFPTLSVATIGSSFHTMIDGKDILGIPQMLPKGILPWNLEGANGSAFTLDIPTLRALLPSAFAIAMLGAIESLLSAVVADGMAGSRHDPDAELFAMGIGNIICPFFGGIAATGAIARTATNVRYGGRSPLSGVVHGFVVLLAVLLLAPLLSYLPMASLAALLLIVAWNMADVKHFTHMIKVAPKSDVLILLTCYFLTVFFDMVIAVTVGVVLASLLFMKRMAETSTSKLIYGEELNSNVALPRGVLIYEIAGPLFFGAADRAMEAMRTIHSEAKVIVLQMGAVPIMDETGYVAFESAINRLTQRKILTVITNLQKQPAVVLKKAGCVEKPGSLIFSSDINSAVDVAIEHIKSQGN